MNAQEFKIENVAKWIWYNGAMGLTSALMNNYIENTREDAVKKMANRDSVNFEEVDNNYSDWYYILPVEQIEDGYLEDYFKSIE